MKRNGRIASHKDEYVIKENVKKTKYPNKKKEQLLIFSTRFNDLLFEQGIHQDKFAEMINMGITSISNYRNGLTLPKIEHIEKIAKALNVSSEYLIGKSETKKYSNNEINKLFGFNDESVAILSSIKNKEVLNLIFNNDEVEIEFLLLEIKKYQETCIEFEQYKQDNQNIDLEKDSKYLDLLGKVQFARFNISQTVMRLIDNNVQ